MVALREPTAEGGPKKSYKILNDMHMPEAYLARVVR